MAGVVGIWAVSDCFSVFDVAFDVVIVDVLDSLLESLLSGAASVLKENSALNQSRQPSKTKMRLLELGLAFSLFTEKFLQNRGAFSFKYASNQLRCGD